MRRSLSLRSYQRGGWAPGSRHQKHMSMNPTIYRYRFAGPRGPGPFTMKYWWTLGCFPTGLEVPFRLPEFLATYQREHVPAEVEEWLQCFVKDPAEVLTECATKLVERMEGMPTPEQGCVYATSAPTVVSLTQPIKTLEAHLGVHVSMVGLRTVAATPQLRLRAMNDLADYGEALRAHGSTPHRRLGQQMWSSTEEDTHRLLTSTGVGIRHVSNDDRSSGAGNSTHAPWPVGEHREDVPRSNNDSDHSETVAACGAAQSLCTGSDNVDRADTTYDAAAELSHVTSSMTETVCSASMLSAMHTPTQTMPDERALLNFLTTVAEGCAATKSYEAAYRTLASSLFLAQDDVSLSLTHANIASAALQNGLFKEAEYHGREAALLETEMNPSQSSSLSPAAETAMLRSAHPVDLRGRGYRLWATALAYQDDLDGAEQVLVDALTLFSDDSAMSTLLRAVQSLRAQRGNLPAELRGHRVQMPAQQARGVVHGAGTVFDNEFDWTIFKNRLYPSKMNPTTNEMGSVFRRVGDMGGARSTSRSTECL